MQKFKHIISLGFFCSVAMELERKGLRTASYPFDWVISDSFENILKLIDNGFDAFLEYESLYQENDKNHYYNSITGVHFYHDFNAFEPLAKQIGNVQKKYQRRIKRFYEDIKEPTLFVRYCLNKEEESYVSNNEKKILSMIQSFNPQNQILYIKSTQTNKELIINPSGGGICELVQPEDDIIRAWIDNVSGLKEHLYSISTLSKWQILKNLYIHYKSRLTKKMKKSRNKTSTVFYNHYLQYNDLKK